MAKQTAGVVAAVNAKDIHIVLGAKGGIGKSYITSILAQYAKHRGTSMKVRDLDQSTATLLKLPTLEAVGVDLLSDKKFDSGKMDEFLGQLMSQDGPYLIDVGASTFIEVWRYLTKYGILEGIEAEGFRLIIHTVVIGGDGMAEVLQGFGHIAETTTRKNLVVWLNPIHGPVVREGKNFLDFNVYKAAEDKVLAVVVLADADEATLRDVRKLGQDCKTLLDVESSEGYAFFTKRRLAAYREELFSQLDEVWGEIDGTDRSA